MNPYPRHIAWTDRRALQQQRERAIQGPPPQRAAPLVRIGPAESESDPELLRQIQRDDLERVSEWLLQVGARYRGGGRSGGPAPLLGPADPGSPAAGRRAFDFADPGLADSLFPAIAERHANSPTSRLFQLFAETNRVLPQPSDEALLDDFQDRLNAQRGQVGLEPVDWRRPGPATRPEPAARVPTPSGRTPRDLSDGSTNIVVDEHLRRVGNRLGVLLANGTSDRAILRFMRDNGVNPAHTNILQGLAYRRTLAYREWARQNPRRPYPIGDLFFSTEVRQALPQRIVSGVANSPVGAYTVHAADAVTVGMLDNLTADPERARAAMADLDREYPVSSATGSFAGTALGTLGFEAAAARAGLHGFRGMRWADFGYGAAHGAGSADEDSRLFGAARGGTLGWLGGMGGRAAMRGTGRLLTGPTQAMTFHLGRHYPIAAGPIAGSGGPIAAALGRIDGGIDGGPIVGGAIRSRTAPVHGAFNRRSFDEALAPIGANTRGVVGEEGVRSAHAAVAGAYRNALDGLRLEADDLFVNDLRHAFDLGSRLPGQVGEDFRFIIRERVVPELETGMLTGEAYQSMRIALREDRHAMRGRPLGGDFEAAIRSVEDALERLVRRQAPEVAPSLDRADRAFAATRMLEDVVGGAARSDGIFTPADLGRALSGRPWRFTGPRPDAAAAPPGLQVLPPRTPDDFSFAPGRTGRILPVPDGRLLLSRPSRLRRAGEETIRRQHDGGMVGAWALPYFVDHGSE